MVVVSAKNPGTNQSANAYQVSGTWARALSYWAEGPKRSKKNPICVSRSQAELGCLL